MKRFILTSLAVTALAVFAFATTADAAPGRGSVHVAPARIVHSAPVHVNHIAPTHINYVAHRNLLVNGRYLNVPYRVAGYRGWSYRCWFPGYRTYGYYCPLDSLWYYWYAPMNQYLPTTYMQMYPPTQYAPPVGYAPSPVMPQGIVPPSGASLVPGPITVP